MRVVLVRVLLFLLSAYKIFNISNSSVRRSIIFRE
uniref:Uncharacterized protein n=1 Tax=CrAss-like virus sp. ctXt06 TaxID=2825837 RepID=A0A8S5V6W7_9CAUD|nr:MAG TPA: hypothetical protein [CrAss-like virus sp. ctXt06]